jgi:hypothetical protein
MDRKFAIILALACILVGLPWPERSFAPAPGTSQTAEYAPR